MKPFANKNRFGAVCLTALMVVSANAQEDKAPSTVQLTAVVAKYRPNAMHDTFDDGFASYDATDLMVVSPKKYVGKLVIYHGEPATASSPWKRVGMRITFGLKTKPLDSTSTQIFSGAAEGFKLIALTRAKSSDEITQIQSLKQEKPGEEVMSRELTALVVRHTPEAMHDTFDDGSSASYDATELRVLTPEEHLGKLVLFHNQPVDDASPWRAIGSKIRFRIDVSLLQSDRTQIFADAADGLERITEGGDSKNDLGTRQRRQSPKRTMERRTLQQPQGHVRRTLVQPSDDKQTEPTTDIG